MNRRGFLGLVAAAVPALILPELLVPKRTFFLPPAGGWAQPSLASMWLDYVNLIRTPGMLVTASEVSTSLVGPGIYERPYGRIELVLPEESDRELIARMRAALAKPPTLRNGFYPVMADLFPWEFS